jgi:hypothetical protein
MLKYSLNKEVKMSISRWLTLAVIIALLGTAALMMHAYSTTTVIKASEPGASSQPSSAVTSPNDPQPQKWQAMDDRFRALYRDTFREAAFQQRWRALDELYRALYPNASASAAMEQRYCNLNQRVYATCTVPTDSH